MTMFEVQGTEVGGYVAGMLVPDAVAALAERALGSKDAVEAELDGMLVHMRLLWSAEPDEAMKIIAAYSARLTELYVNLHRVEARNREYRQVRTQQVVPMLEELDRQFKLASRAVEIRRQDLEVLR